MEFQLICEKLSQLYGLYANEEYLILKELYAKAITVLMNKLFCIASQDNDIAEQFKKYKMD